MAKLKIGDTPRRVEDARFLTGSGCYVDDLQPENLAHAAVVRAPHAHADLQGIDAAAAKDMPGVITVLTGGDLEAAGIGPMQPYEQVNVYSGDPFRFPTQYPLARDRVRYAGEPVALVIAESRSEALDAAEAVAVDTKTGAILPFQVLSTRKRKEASVDDIQVKVCVFAFDLIYLNGESYLQKPLAERRHSWDGVGEPATCTEHALAPVAAPPWSREPGAAQLSGSVMLGTSTVVSGPSGAASDEKLRAEPCRTRPHGTASGASVACGMRSRTAAGSRPPPGAPPAGGLGGASSKVVHASWMGAAKRT